MPGTGELTVVTLGGGDRETKTDLDPSRVRSGQGQRSRGWTYHWERGHLYCRKRGCLKGGPQMLRREEGK